MLPTTSKLTPAAARDLTAGHTIYDHEVVGLHLRAGASSKTWTLFYRTRAGEQRKRKIGRFPEMSLADARSTAKELKQRVALGEDPSADWKAARDAPTVNKLCDDYLESWAPSRLSSKTLKQQTQIIDTYIRPGLGSKKLAEVQPKDVDRFLEAVFNRRFVDPEKRKQAGTTAHWTAFHTKRLLSGLFNRAEDYFQLELPKGNPCRHSTVYGRKKRKRHATLTEMPRLFVELERLAEAEPLQAACILTLFYTGGRVSEILEARASQRVVKQNGQQVLRLAKHKTERFIGEKEIVLPRAAVDILEKLPAPNGDRIFGEVSLRRIEAVWAGVRSAAGCDDLKLLDARRTFASFGLSQGLSLEQIGETLGHTDTATTKGYAYLVDELKARSANTAADAIAAAAGAK